MKLQVLRNIWAHPATKGDRARAIARALTWEFQKRVTSEAQTRYLVGGIRVRCDPAMGGSHVAITYRGLYDFHDMCFLRCYLRPGDEVVDVGANIGLFSLMVARLVGPTGRVDAFEAAPRTVELLRNNVELNPDLNIHVHSLAVSDHDGEVQFTQGPSDLVNRILDRDSSLVADKAATVACCRLDDVIADRNYAFAQLDVEGAEPLVLTGASKMLEHGNPPVLSIEINGRLREFGWSEDALVDWLQARNYDVGIFDAEKNLFKFENRKRGISIQSLMGERDNALAIWRPKKEEVMSRVLTESSRLASRLNTRNNQPWP